LILSDVYIAEDGFPSVWLNIQHGQLTIHLKVQIRGEELSAQPDLMT
jgi:hypothetical protein